MKLRPRNLRLSLAERQKVKGKIMWNSSQSGGGFMNDTATTPSKGSAGGGKNKKQNIVPVILFQSHALERFGLIERSGDDQ